MTEEERKAKPPKQRGGYTKEMREAKRKTLLRDLEVDNQEAEALSVRQTRNAMKRIPVMREGSNGQKLDFIYDKVLQLFIDEISARSIGEYNIFDDDSVKRRKNQMSIARDTMAMIKQLRELKVQVVEDETCSASVVFTQEHKDLFGEARKLLSDQGIEIDESLLDFAEVIED